MIAGPLRASVSQVTEQKDYRAPVYGTCFALRAILQCTPRGIARGVAGAETNRRLVSRPHSCEKRPSRDGIANLVRPFDYLPHCAGSASQGRKAFTWQTVPALARVDDGRSVAKTAGFWLHAGVASEAHEREKLERLRRYITRPAIATERLLLTAQGHIRYRLKTPYRDCTTDVVLLRGYSAWTPGLRGWRRCARDDGLLP